MLRASGRASRRSDARSPRRGRAWSAPARLRQGAERGDQAAGEHVALDPVRARAVAAVALVGDEDRLDAGTAAGREDAVDGGEEDVEELLADRLDHLDRGDLRNSPSTSRKSSTRISTRSASPASRDARAAPASACSGESVIPVTRAPYSPAATRANEPQPQPISSTWSPGPSSSFSQTSRNLRQLCVGERLVPVLEDGARVRHRLVEEEREEVVAEVVVVANVPCGGEEAVAAVGPRPQPRRSRRRCGWRADARSAFRASSSSSPGRSSERHSPAW